MSKSPKAIEFRVDAKPIAQPRHQSMVVNGQVRTFEAKSSHPIHLFKAMVRQAARQAYNGEPLEGALSVAIDFRMPRPVSKTFKTRPNPRYPHTSTPDFDNLAKSVCDACNKLIWVDDSQIAHSEISKLVCAGGEQPHVLVRVCQMEVE